MDFAMNRTPNLPSMASPQRKTETSDYDSRQKKIKGHHYLNVFKPPFYIPDDILENIFSFFPIKEAINTGLVSTRFKKSWLLSRNLHFGRDFTEGRSRFHCVEMINNTFDRHEGSKIHSFILYLDPTGIQSYIETWIQKSIEKEVEELELDFLEGGRIIMPSMDLSCVESLRILKLCLCEFQMPMKPKGMKFLNTLVLSRIHATSEMIDSVFRNCFHLETLELIGCLTIRDLRIRARNQKKFSSLVVACCPNLRRIDADAPTLKSFLYCGLIFTFRFIDVLNLKDAMLHFVRSRDFTQSFRVIDIVFDLCHIHVLTTTSVFLEGLTRRVVDGELREVNYRFWNLKEFQVFMEAPSYCNLFDIANFLKNCPSLERFYLDLNNFTFECGLYWEAHQRQRVEEYPYRLNSLKFVEMKGFKCHRHELDIVQFFLERAPFLEALVLVTPKKNKTRIYYPDYARIHSLKQISPNVKIRLYEDSDYKSPISPKHVKEWF